MSKKKKDKLIDCIVKDWNGKNVILLKSVCQEHIANAAHNDSYLYYETLKSELKNPEFVVESRRESNVKIANIKLTNRRHNYLIVVIKYAKFLNKLIGMHNYVATFYPTDKSKKGKIIWKQK